MEYIEYTDAYVIRRGVYYNRCKDTEFEINLMEGVAALFTEAKSKRNSKQFRLSELIFDKDIFDIEDIQDYWRDWDIRYLDAKHINKCFPQIEFIIGEPGNLVKGGYVFGMYRNASEYTEKESFSKQLKEILNQQVLI